MNFTNQGNAGKNAKEKKVQLVQLLWAEEEKRKLIFHAFPRRAKSSMACRNTYACICTYVHQLLGSTHSEKLQEQQRAPYWNSLDLAPVPKPSPWLPFQSMLARALSAALHWRSCSGVNSNTREAFAHSVHHLSAACSRSVYDSNQIAKLPEGNAPPEGVCAVGTGIEKYEWWVKMWAGIYIYIMIALYWEMKLSRGENTV